MKKLVVCSLVLMSIIISEEIDFGLFKVKFGKKKVSDGVVIDIRDMDSISYLKRYVLIRLRDGRVYKVSKYSVILDLYTELGDRELFYDLKPKGRIRVLKRRFKHLRFKIFRDSISIVD